MVAHFGLEVVQAYMRHVQDNAEESVRRVLDVLKDGRFSYPLDNGSKIEVRITVDKAAREPTIDFTGTSPQDRGNFNDPTPGCKAAVLYVFRPLVEEHRTGVVKGKTWSVRVDLGGGRSIKKEQVRRVN